MEKIVDIIEGYAGEPLDRLVAVAGRVMEKIVPLMVQLMDFELNRLTERGDVAARMVEQKIPENIIRELVAPKDDVTAVLLPMLVKYLPLIYQEAFPADLAVSVDCAGKNVVVHVREDATIGDLLKMMQECKHDSPVLKEIDLSSAWIVDAAAQIYPLETKIISLAQDASFFLTLPID